MLKKVPEEIDYEQTAKIMSDDPSPLNVVLLQEVTTLLRLLVLPSGTLRSSVPLGEGREILVGILVVRGPNFIVLTL